MQVNARQIDQPIAALMRTSSSAACSRTPCCCGEVNSAAPPPVRAMTAGTINSRGYTMLAVGGGMKSGFRYGADPVSGAAIEGKMYLHDLHATMLHLLGLDHTKLTYPYGGRNFRLTEVYGNVVQDILV